MLFSFFFYCSVDHRDLHSFPTRRSSDLAKQALTRSHAEGSRGVRDRSEQPTQTLRAGRFPGMPIIEPSRGPWEAVRSEEHTSELQSRGHLVCRLLLEKKKKKKKKETSSK